MALSAQAVDERVDLLINSLRTEGNKKYLEGVHKSLVSAGSPAVTPLISLLSHPKADVRYRAAAVLIDIRDVRARAAMTDLLDDPDPDVRGLAVRATGILKSSSAVEKLLAPVPENDSVAFRRSVRTSILYIGDIAGPALCRLLDDPDTNVKTWALGCLAELRAAPTNRLDTLFNSGDLQLRLACVDAAGRTGHRPLLARALSAEEWAVRRHAARGVGNVRCASCVPSLLQLVSGDPHPAVRSQAAFSLARIGTPEAMAALGEIAEREGNRDRAMAVFSIGLAARPDSSAILLAALRAADPAVRRAAAHALGRLPPSAPASDRDRSIDALISALSDPNASVRRAAQSSLATMTGAAVLDAIAGELSRTESHALARTLSLALATMGPEAETRLVALLSSDAENVRGLAAEALGAMRSKRAIPPLVALLDSASAGPVSQSAVIALADIGPDAAPALIKRLAGAEPHVVARAREALSGMDGPALTDALMTALSSDAPTVRCVAASVLGARRKSAAVPELVWTLDHDRDISVRVAAADALGLLGNKLATAPLIRATRHQNEVLRKSAASALGCLSDGRATGALKSLLNDDDPGVASAAHAALSDLQKK